MPKDNHVVTRHKLSQIIPAPPDLWAVYDDGAGGVFVELVDFLGLGVTSSSVYNTQGILLTDPVVEDEPSVEPYKFLEYWGERISELDNVIGFYRGAKDEVPDWMTEQAREKMAAKP